MCKMFDLGYIFNFYFISVVFHFILFSFFISGSHGRRLDKLGHVEFSDTEFRIV